LKEAVSPSCEGPLTFDSNQVLKTMLGECNENLSALESLAHVKVTHCGNALEVVSGTNSQRQLANRVLRNLYRYASNYGAVCPLDVERILKVTSCAASKDSDDSLEDVIHITFGHKRRRIIPKTLGQVLYLKKMREHPITFALGAAGTGKTYLAVALGLAELAAGRVRRLVLSRPAVEAGEHLGFLPGDIKEKIDPYLRPLYDALYDMSSPEFVVRKLENQEIEIAPLAYMRGRTLDQSFIIVDEGQNITKIQMQMLLTRLGNGSKMVVTGDLSQVDLPHASTSGMIHAVEILKKIPEVTFCTLGEHETLRHPLVSKIIRAYAKDVTFPKSSS
jgi:phosphate starvation-inducible PhoH-like protein